MHLNYLASFTFLFLMSSTSLPAEALKVDVSAEAAIMINADTGDILYEKNAHALHYPASITKVATCVYALKQKGNSLEDLVTADQESIASISPEAKIRSGYKVPAYWVEVASNHMGLKRDEQMPLKDIFHGLMLTSANDGANLIATYTSGSVPNFVKELNAYVKDIGCKNTTFSNPHGLHHPQHQTTAYDMALITREGLKDPAFRQIVSTVKYMRPKTNKQEPVAMSQSNRLLKAGTYHYPKAIGVKTGYTSLASNTFVGAATHEGRTLIVVLLKVKDRGGIYKDAISLFDAAFKQPKIQRVLLKQGPQKFTLNLANSTKPITTYIQEPVSIELYAAEDPHVKAYLYWDEIAPPISKNQKIGEIRLISAKGQTLKSVPLLAQEDVSKSFLAKFKSVFSNPVSMIIVAAIALITAFLFIRFRKA